MNDVFLNQLLEMFGASARVLFEVRKGMKPDDVTQGQLDIMEYIFFNGDASLSHLSDCLYLSMPNASREVKKLTEKGYLDKQYNETDKRTHRIVLSERGNQLMQGLLDSYNERIKARYAHLEEKDEDEYIQLMKDVTEKLLF